MRAVVKNKPRAYLIAKDACKEDIVPCSSSSVNLWKRLERMTFPNNIIAIIRMKTSASAPLYSPIRRGSPGCRARLWTAYSRISDLATSIK